MSKSVKKTICCMRVLVVSKFLRLLSKILVLVVTELAVSGTQCTKSSTQSCIVLNIFLPLAIDCNFKIVVLFYDNGEKQLSFLVYICHGFVSAGDALGRERPATPMSSFLAGHSGCKWPNTYLLLGRAPLGGAYGRRSLLRSTLTLEGSQRTGARITKWMGR